MTDGGLQRLNNSFPQQQTSDTQQSHIPGIHISANAWMQIVKHRTEGSTLHRDIEGVGAERRRKKGQKNGDVPNLFCESQASQVGMVQVLS
jgi:hypothetical protein